MFIAGSKPSRRTWRRCARMSDEGVMLTLASWESIAAAAARALVGLHWMDGDGGPGSEVGGEACRAAIRLSVRPRPDPSHACDHASLSSRLSRVGL